MNNYTIRACSNDEGTTLDELSIGAFFYLDGKLLLKLDYYKNEDGLYNCFDFENGTTFYKCGKIHVTQVHVELNITKSL